MAAMHMLNTGSGIMIMRKEPGCKVRLWKRGATPNNIGPKGELGTKQRLEVGCRESRVSVLMIKRVVEKRHV